MFIANDGRIMGTRNNGRLTDLAGWFTVALMSAAALAWVALELSG